MILNTVRNELTLRTLCDLSPDSGLGEEWERIVEENPASGIMQSLHWAAMKRQQGLDFVHFGLFEQGKLVGGSIFYMSKSANGAGILVAPEGPVLEWNNREKSLESMRLLTSAAREFASANGIMSMRIEPRLAPPQPAILREFGRGPVDLVPRETLYLDLSLSEVELFDGMKHKGRYNIKLAEKSGVVVSECTSIAAVNRFYDAVQQASQRDCFALENREFFNVMAQHLCSAGHAEFLLARHEGDLLGALLLIKYGHRATYLYGGITDIKRNLMGGYALQWAAIRRARELGCRVYDFYGYVEHRSPEHRYSRFSQFKSQFGGESRRFIGSQEYFFLDNVAEAFSKAAREIAEYSRDELTTVAREEVLV